jgi:selenocysteine lyase/cysteine desulfurase
MSLSRRGLFKFAGGASVTGIMVAAAARAESIPPVAPAVLPDKANFVFEGIHMNAAYTHAIGLPTAQASRLYMESRMRDVGRNWPADNARDQAVALYASMINAAPSELAVVPSTLEGENLIAAALNLGPGAGAVTDAFHYDASLVHYGEMNKRGMPLTVIAPRENRIDYKALDAAITRETRLVAVSLVASATGFRHDLKRLCEIAHAKGAYVYADVIQAVGGIPFDVKDSGVDFCCAGHYKWLMGEFGAAFLYVRADRLADLRRTQLGWRGMTSYQSHVLPSDPPGPPIGDWTLGSSTANIFEVSTANWGGLAATAASLKYILDLGVDRINAHRLPMLDRLQQELPRAGFLPMTPRDAQGPAVVFYKAGLRDQIGSAAKAAKIFVTLYKDRVRISPSVHNDMNQVEKVIAVLTGKT